MSPIYAWTWGVLLLAALFGWFLISLHAQPAQTRPIDARDSKAAIWAGLRVYVRDA